MHTKKMLGAIGEISDKYVWESAPAEIDQKNQNFSRRRLLKRTLGIAAAAALVLCLSAFAVAASLGFNILDTITRAFKDPHVGVIQEQLEKGQWAYLNGGNIAVIVPESPVRILLSGDGGDTWRESVVSGSGEGFHAGELREGIQYLGGYIGFPDDENGYLVLTTAPALGSQDARIFLSDDGGDAWEEIGNLNEFQRMLVAGSGFSSPEVGFMSYRYYLDAGPDIWRTTDRGQTWERLTVELPEEYRGSQYRFTPRSPVFEGKNGIYPISVTDQSKPGQDEITINMYSGDGGLSWSFDR